MQVKQVEVGSLSTKCSIVWDEVTRKTAVFDPGDWQEPLISELDKGNYIIEYIIITHEHSDHVKGVRRLLEDCRQKGQDPKVYMHSEEKAIMESKASKNFEKHFFDLDVDLKGKKNLDLGFAEFEIFEVPGHTSHSLCFYNKDQELLIAGDTLFYHDIGTSQYYKGDPMDLRHNIEKILLALPKDVIVVPGHGPNTTIGEERMNNPYLRYR